MASLKSQGHYPLEIALVCAILMSCSFTNAERVQIPVGQQGNSGTTAKRPPPGITKDQVQQRLGDPTSSKKAIGKPPISSWNFDDFTVYFENDRVIHSVLKYKPTNTLKTEN